MKLSIAACFTVGCRYWPMVRKSTSATRKSSITCWISIRLSPSPTIRPDLAATFGHWLAAADLGVQLRSADLGETSAAVLDCMNHGLPTIANAIGSMAELPADAVCLLPEDYTDQALTDTLTGLWRDAERRAALGGRARATVIREHDAGRCAALYRDAIERAYEI